MAYTQPTLTPNIKEINSILCDAEAELKKSERALENWLYFWELWKSGGFNTSSLFSYEPKIEEQREAFYIHIEASQKNFELAYEKFNAVLESETVANDQGFRENEKFSEEFRKIAINIYEPFAERIAGGTEQHENKAMLALKIDLQQTETRLNVIRSLFLYKLCALLKLNGLVELFEKDLKERKTELNESLKQIDPPLFKTAKPASWTKEKNTNDTKPTIGTHREPTK